MPKASPAIRSFNAGEFSELLDGRVDLDRYPASLRKLKNFIAAPQGPAISRSGTAFVVSANDNDKQSVLLPFVFSNEQAKMLEVADGRIRFIDEDGIQVYASETLTPTSLIGDPIEFTSATLNGDVGDQVVLNGFPVGYNLNGEIVKITAKVGNDYTLEKSWPVGKPLVNGSVARVYHIDASAISDERQKLRFVQSVDVMYLMFGSIKPYKLSRYGDYDWRLEVLALEDGPYMPVNETPTKLTPSATGNALPNMTSDTAPSGTCSGSSNRPAVIYGGFFLGRTMQYIVTASEYYYAFDDDDGTYWAPNQGQSGIIQYDPAAAFACNGYSIYTATENIDDSYMSKDYAPSTFVFEGRPVGGGAWVTLDRQENYVLYDQDKSVFFEIENEVDYEAYRLRVIKLFRNGRIEPRVRRLVLRSTGSVSITFTASGTEGINNDTGFQSTDVGRALRVKGSDNSWRWLTITAVNSTTEIVAKLETEPLLNLDPIQDWRLGYWSDTTGWPSAGAFFEDRLWLVSSSEAPDMFAASVTGAYELFAQTDVFGEVLDDSAIVGRLNSRRLSKIRWLSSDERGLLMGTGSEEYVLSAPNEEALTARNIKARPTTRRGSADVEPVRIDNQVLFVQRSGRTLREFAFVFEADGYRSPSMTQLASHLGQIPFAEMDFAAEPHSIVWVKREDGSLVGLTYNRDENVIGWHQHDISGGVVESIAVMPQKDQLQDTLWMVVKRVIDGNTVRYIERLTRFWDFDTELSDAHFVDSGLRYEGVATSNIYGLQHLEGEEVYGLADTRPVGPFVVQNGAVELPYEASNVILGLGFDSEGETSRLENGAADGTAQGKVKRINSMVGAVWRSFGGEVGVYNEQEGGPVYEPLEYPGDYSQFEEIELYTGMIGPFAPSVGYDKEGIVYFKRPKSSPLPFNVTSLLPQLNTQDR